MSHTVTADLDLPPWETDTPSNVIPIRHNADKMAVLTYDTVLAGRSGSGGWNARQVALLGLKWPLVKGWQQQVVGKAYQQSVLDRFVAEKGNTAAKRKSQEAYNSEAERRAANARWRAANPDSAGKK